MSCGVGCRRGSDPVLLWLGCRLAAIARMRPLAWEPPYALSAALKRQQQQRQKISSDDSKGKLGGVPVVVQWKGIRLGTMRLQVRSLALLSGLRIWHCHELWCRSKTWLRSGIAVSCGVGCRPGSDPEFLWLWRRPAATAPIRPLAWEPPYAAGAAQQMAKDKKKKNTIGF